MAYKKKFGNVTVKLTKVWPNFIDAICAKTGREIIFQTKYKISDSFKAFLMDKIEAGIQLTIWCRPHTEEGMYWYHKISAGEHLGHRNRTKKEIAMQNLMSEVEKDYNPIHTGAIRQGLVTGRGGLPTAKNTSGKIGGALIRNIARPDSPELNRLAKTRKDRMKALRDHRARETRIEERYLEWCEENKKPQDDKTWTKFLKEYKEKGGNEEKMIQTYESTEEEIAMLKEDEKLWKELLRG